MAICGELKGASKQSGDISKEEEVEHFIASNFLEQVWGRGGGRSMGCLFVVKLSSRLLRGRTCVDAMAESFSQEHQTWQLQF